MKTLRLCIIALTAAFASSCSESEYLYDSQDCIYFNFKDTASSKLTYSFAYTPGKREHTLLVPVRISGGRSGSSRVFGIAIVDSLTTAKAGVHYRALSESYTIAADSGTFQLPVTLLNEDTEMEDSTFVLALKLVDSPDFKVEYPHLISTRISFSNRLEKPEWWEYSSWKSQLGDYSRTKHYLFLISSGTIDLSNPNTEGEKTMQSMSYIHRFKEFMSDPGAWVRKHPEYAFDELVPDSMYLFYDKSKPQKTYSCMKINMGTMGVRYMFFDEYGSPIMYV